MEVPGETDLAQLHEVVQHAIGWTDSHLHEFEVGGTRYGPPDEEDDEVRDEAGVQLAGRLGPR